MRRIHFIRHGKTERNSESGQDYDRRLIDRGHNQSREIGNNLRAPSDTIVLCSGAKRTRETLAGILENADLSNVTFRDDLYLCNSKLYLELIWEETEDAELMFVGHNFGISDVVSYLSGTDIEMRTGEYIVLDFDVNNWDEISADLGTISFRYRLPNV